MSDRYIVSYTFADGDTRVVDRVYSSQEDAEIVLKAARINSPKLTHAMYKLVPVETEGAA